KWRSDKNAKFDDILPINSTSSGHRGMEIPPFEPAHRDESNGGIPILLRPLDAEIFEWRRDKNADLMTFRRISRRPVVVEEWEYHHSIRLDEPVRMVVFPFFYEHWTPRYSTKRQMAQYRK